MLVQAKLPQLAGTLYHDKPGTWLQVPGTVPETAVHRVKGTLSRENIPGFLPEYNPTYTGM